MITTEKAKELREKERQQTIDTLESINKEKKYFKQYYEAYSQGFGMGYLIAEQGEFIEDDDFEKYIKDTWKQFFYEKEQEENNE